MSNQDDASNAYGAPVPDTGMASGSDTGTPGEVTDATPLTADEQALLAALSQPSTPVVPDPLEESGEVAPAVEDDRPLPAEDFGVPPGPQADTPAFREP